MNPGDLPGPSRLKGRTLTVSGIVTVGAEPGCLLLGAYQLLGSARPELRAGRTVTVTGHLVPDIVTTCQQGTPLQVERVVSAR